MHRKGMLAVSSDSCIFPHISLVQSLSHIWLFATPWTAAHQASLSCTQSLLKLMSMSRWCHPTMSSSVVISSRLQSFPASGSFLMSQLFASDGQSPGASTSASVLLMTIQDWFPLGLTDLISLQSKGLLMQRRNSVQRKISILAAQGTLNAKKGLNPNAKEAGKCSL